MERLESLGEKPLDKVRSFCVDFSGGNIIELSGGIYEVERLNEQGNPIAVYKFSPDGELQHFTALDTPYKMPSDFMELEENKKKYPVIPLIKKQTSGFREKTS
jgi:hypothetical protein